MPGQQLDFAIRGDQYETFAESLLLRFASPIRVPRPRDFGLDFYCSLRAAQGEVSQTTRQLFALQVGGPGKSLRYGGLADGRWKTYEIEWLKSLTVPLYFGSVDSELTRLRLHSLAPLWRVLFRSPGAFRMTVIRFAQAPLGAAALQ